MHRIALKMIVFYFAIWSIPSALAQDIAFEDYDMVRNGDFESRFNSWHCPIYCPITSFGAKDGAHGLQLKAHNHTFQFLPIPTEVRSATLRFEYQAESKIGLTENVGTLVVYFGTSPVPENDNFEETYSFDDFDDPIFSQLIDKPFFDTHFVYNADDIYPKTKWITFEKQLDQTQINALNNAQDNGNMVFLVMSHRGNDTSREGSYVHNIDNVSLTINGTQKVPKIPGKIAYIETAPDEITQEMDPHAINILDPATTGVTNIWTHPGRSVFPWDDIVWHPDASEIAFTSDHEFLASVFEADIYAMKPDGSNFRKVTGAPSQDEIEKAGYPRITVKGRLQNLVDDWEASMNFLMIGAQYGKDHAVFYSHEGNMDAFMIQNVPVLDDPKVFDQTLIIHFSNEACTYGIEYKATSAPVVDGVADIGVVRFMGIPCLKMLGNYVPHDLTWKADGSEIAYRKAGGFKKVSSASSRSWTWTKLDPSGGMLGSGVQWSPTENNRFLYIKWGLSNGDALMIADEGGEGQVLVEGGVKPFIQPAWLPDGSGIVYVGETQDRSESPVIYYYDMASGKKQRLTYMLHEDISNVSVAPDGRHIVFELHHSTASEYSDLWMLDRENPVNIWRVTRTQNCTSPAWSPKEVPLDTDEPPDGNTGPGGGDDNGNGGGGGGGCFVSSCAVWN